MVVQPANRETGPGLLLPLTYLYKRYPEAPVAVFPSDQFILEADHLMRHIRLAQAVVERHPSKLVLLGVTPDYEESDYGYILPTSARDTTWLGNFDGSKLSLRSRIFCAPTSLIGQGALWNTMLMVFNAGALLRWVSELHPKIYDYFARIYDAIGTEREADTVASSVSDSYPPSIFPRNCSNLSSKNIPAE